MTKQIKIYTDGACSQNKDNGDLEGWHGGWGVFALVDGVDYVMSGSEMNTTNNEMELVAMLRSLEFIKKFVTEEQELNISIYTDSAYISNCFNDKWYAKWEYNGWKTSAKQPVKNKELWIDIIKEYRTLVSNSNVKLEILKVKAHADDFGNKKADI